MKRQKRQHRFFHGTAFGADGEICSAAPAADTHAGTETIPRIVSLASLVPCSNLSFSPLDNIRKDSIRFPKRCLLGGEGEIRTLEALLMLTRFPVVRARPATRLLHRFALVERMLFFLQQWYITTLRRICQAFCAIFSPVFFDNFTPSRRPIQTIRTSTPQAPR